MQLWQWLLPVTAAFFFPLPNLKAARNVQISLLARSLARLLARPLVQTPELQSWKPLSHCDPIFTGLGRTPSHSLLVFCPGCSAAAPPPPPHPQLSHSYIRLSIQRRAPQQNNKQLLKHSGRLDSACCRCPSISWPHSRSRRRKKIYTLKS